MTDLTTDAFKQTACRKCGGTIQPEGDTGPSVVCNWCGWEGDEDGLIATLDAEDGEPCRACPECRTDCNLMDHPPQPSETVAEALAAMEDSTATRG